MSKKKWCGLLAILMAVSIVFTSGALRPVNVYAETIADLQEQSEEHQKKLEENGLYTMGDIARCSLGGAREFHNEELLYRLFGINAELLIDHAWGWEPVTMEQIKAYRPQVNSISSGQVLHCPYPFEKTRLVMREMAEQLSLDLVEKGLTTNQVVITVGYCLLYTSDAADE